MSAVGTSQTRDGFANRSTVREDSSENEIQIFEISKYQAAM